MKKSVASFKKINTMKRIITNSFIVALGMVALVACKKDEITIQKNDNVNWITISLMMIFVLVLAMTLVLSMHYLLQA